jgi:hypothetical protein
MGNICRCFVGLDRRSCLTRLPRQAVKLPQGLLLRGPVPLRMGAPQRTADAVRAGQAHAHLVGQSAAFRAGHAERVGGAEAGHGLRYCALTRRSARRARTVSVVIHQ